MAELKIKADSGGGTVSLKGPATTTSNAAVQLTLPVDDGAANQYLKTDGSGALSWATVDTSIADDSITEAKLDIHAAPSGTDKFLGYTSNGMEWAVPGGGKIIKVWHTGTGGGEGIGGTVHSSTYVKKGWIDITPTSASNKILIVAKYNAHFRNQQNNENGNHYYTKLMRTSAWDDTSSPQDGEVLLGGIWAKDTGMELIGGSAVHWWLDAPATTSNRRYAFYAKCNSTDWKIYLNYLSTPQDIFAFEIADIVDAPPD